MHGELALPARVPDNSGAQLWACCPVKDRKDKVSAPGRSQSGEALTDRRHSDPKL